jgi:hypothetical protein
MGLVLAMVAWVATMDAPNGHGRPGNRVLIGRTLAIYRGASPVSRRHFQITGTGNWGISWEFSCPAGQHGAFTITTDAASGSDGRERIGTSGSAGHGIYWHSSDPGHHLILITSSCPWTVRVVLARRPGGQPGRRSPPGSITGHGHGHKAAAREPQVKHSRTPWHPKKPAHPKKPRHPKKARHPRKAGHGK